jgi:hypothetical protein
MVLKTTSPDGPLKKRELDKRDPGAQLNESRDQDTMEGRRVGQDWGQLGALGGRAQGQVVVTPCRAGLLHTELCFLHTVSSKHTIRDSGSEGFED